MNIIQQENVQSWQMILADDQSDLTLAIQALFDKKQCVNACRQKTLSRQDSDLRLYHGRSLHPEHFDCLEHIYNSFVAHAL